MKLNELKDIVNLTDIADALGCKIEKIGARLWIPCPFHSDKNPSFLLNEKFGYCFTCKESADAFKLTMKVRQCEFIEAATFIADYYNVTLDKKDEHSSERRVSLQERLDEALISYQNALNDECKEYLAKRGINEESIRNFRLGYGISYVKKEDELKLHLFNERLTIPIFNNKKLVGFGGRSLEKNPKIKYINSPESEIFHKSNLLFGFDNYHIKKQNCVIIVEGYFDVILAHQYGYKNVVATLGTALNDFHIKKLSKITNNIYFLFDNDNAGLQTSLKAARTYINNEFCKIGVIDFKGYKDLGELLLKDSESLKRIKTKELALFLCENEMLNYKEGNNNIQVINNIVSILNLLNSNYLKSYFRTKICEIYNLDISYFSLSVKNEQPIIAPNMEQKSQIEASILIKCLESKKNLQYVKTYLEEKNFIDFYDIAKKIFENIALDENEINLIKIYANDNINLMHCVAYKIRHYALYMISQVSKDDKINNLAKAQKIKELQENLSKINQKAGLNAR
ncbi:toprim domain-containing protein [Campylobacter canadensis]|uniref:toprim domain-containing protein n=1 Tax=Campylobacter canadensis TaxID=449520 RepID=UPI00155695D0|nr:toprim domain-containing protein [Campylobacter canadensis]MBZ7995177.1 toprim domain-containing protein [Campylobacter canadensis]MBZ7997126.1 toprim domain-containing protein [Campylobacter canadensis]MBZ8000541.1 toprim domain-containing protein [Campylobacter canadensis]MBZ8003852.1 toprim domain-containing protein [Campylobacter canadensis]